MYALVCKSLVHFNEAFIPYNKLQSLNWPSIFAHSPARLMYIIYGLVILVHRNIQVTTEWFSHMNKSLQNISFSLKIHMLQAKMILCLSLPIYSLIST